MTGKDNWELPVQGPAGEPVTYAMAKAYAHAVLDRPAASADAPQLATSTDDERALARLVLALCLEAEA